MRSPRFLIPVTIVALLSAGALAWATSHRATGSAAAARVSLLLGDSRIELRPDEEPAGRAEAFPFRARVSGRPRWAALYVDTGSQARVVDVALYRDAGGHPGTLLMSGSARKPAVGAWTHIRLRGAAAVQRGSRYWVALLGLGGAVAYRDRTEGPCRSSQSAERNLAAFQRRWSDGTQWPTCPMSVAISSTQAFKLQAPPRSGSPTSAPGQPDASTIASARGEVNCVAAPAHCGYPDADTTGVPAGTVLTPSVSVSATVPGAVISNLSVAGTIDVYASNVTIKDTQVTVEHVGDPGIVIHAPATGVLIEDSTVGGPAGSTPPAGIAIHNTTPTAVTIRRVNIHNAADGISGLQHTSDSYIITDGMVPGAHVEPVYVPGAGPSNPRSTIDHNTLLNPQRQTSAIFADCHTYGPCWNMSFDGNLVAGGDYTIECCDGPGAVGPSGHTSIVNNRFARRYYRSSGQYGWESGVDRRRTIWSGNVWDNTGSPVGAP